LRRACIDIGSNTTRLLVADCDGNRLVELHQERAFTRIGGALRGGTIDPAKILEVAGVVAGQMRTALEFGSVEVRGVATAAIRRAHNGAALISAIDDACGLEVKVLSGDEEARLAFVGAARTLDHVPTGDLGVVDVGGGSSELVVGTAPDRVSWSTSFGIGSADLAEDCLHSDPPAAAELSAARRQVERMLEGLEIPHPSEAVAVGGSAASLRRFAGAKLDVQSINRSLALLASHSAAAIAAKFALEVERVRLLPAGLLILQAASERFGRPLQVGLGGLREGVLFEAGAADV
jgi:exopolyphosphatase / guanosine-5'-triphosphate,3'-diphosphate pyrophosphatase